MTKKKAKEWLKAVRSLRAYYKGENDLYRTYSCPLCEVNDLDDCLGCLWLLFGKQSCEGYALRGDSSYIAAYELRETRHPKWTALAIKRLDRWESKLLTILGEKK